MSMLQDSEHRLRATLDSMLEGCQIIGFDWRYVYLNDTAAAHGRQPKQALLGRTITEAYPGIDQTEMFAALKECMERRVPRRMENEFIAPDGSRSWFQLSIEPVPEGIFVLSIDITERKQAEIGRLEAQERYRLAREVAQVGVWDWDLATNAAYIDPGLKAILGFEDREIPDRWEDWIERVHPEDREHVTAAVRRHLEGKTPRYEVERRMLHKDGTVRHFLARGTAMRDAAGKPVRMLGADLDVTERHRLEQQFRHAQKMEAVGRLAGGIAHDFNNLLGVITGYTELLLGGLGPAHAQARRVEEIRKAAERAARLTRQLLAFSRKQMLQPKVLDLNAVVADIEPMLRRLIGEDVRVEMSLADPLPRVKVDPGQIEQVIVNLAVNARDAMPRGGTLLLETTAAELDESYEGSHPGARAGPHVLLAMSDTGHGMDQATLSRVFEPFFTTKEPGKGTGLGLSTAYGIVKQSGGSIAVYSEPGRGTTVKVYLPVADGEPEALAAGTSGPPRGHETILVVEDEEALREVIREMLEEAGYTVVEAASREEALSQARSHGGAIRLLLTDVVLPDANGREIAQDVRGAQPEVRVLYMSGYTDGAIAHHGVIDAGVHFINKPFRSDALLRKVREVLDAG